MKRGICPRVLFHLREECCGKLGYLGVHCRSVHSVDEVEGRTEEDMAVEFKFNLSLC